jgi:hypothetical protein
MVWKKYFSWQIVLYSIIIAILNFVLLHAFKYGLTCGIYLNFSLPSTISNIVGTYIIVMLSYLLVNYVSERSLTASGKIKKIWVITLSVVYVVIFTVVLSIVDLSPSCPYMPAPMPDPTETYPIEVDSLELYHGKEYNFIAKYYNTFSSGVVEPVIECFGSLEGLKTENLGGDISFSSSKVKSNSVKTFKFTIPVGKDPGSGICEIKFCSANEQEGGRYLDNKCNTGNEKSEQITIKIS